VELVYAEIELINGEDIVLAKRHIIGEEEIKKMTINFLVDTGSYMLVLMKPYKNNCNFL
jgi:hypothetical protein